MRILHYVEGRCNPDTANGVDKTIYFLCREQARMGHEVHLVSTTDKDLIAIEGVILHRVRPVRVPWSSPLEVEQVLDEVKPEVVHLHSAYVPGNIVFARLAGRRGIRHVVTPNGNCSRTLLRRRPWLKIPYKRLLERPMMNSAAFVHSVGDSAQIRDYGVSVPVVEGLNGMDFSEIPEDLDAGFISSRYPAWGGRCVFVFIGRLDIEQKGLDLLIEAFAAARQSRPGLALLLVGPEWQGSVLRLKAMIAARSLEDSVELHGPAFGKEKFDLIRSASAFVHASRWEGLPFAVVEAMAVGTACVVTQPADPAGLLESKGVGIVVEAEAGAISRGLLQAAELGDEGRALLGGAGRAVVAGEMSWERAAAKVCEGYRRHCGKGAGG